MYPRRNEELNTLFIKTKKFVFISFILGCLILGGSLFIPTVDAATSYFSPSSGNFTVGNIFTVTVSVNTKGVDINNAEGVIRFPTDLLEIVSINKSGSIFSLWVEEPNFSNNAGTISFNGGLPTPGYNGASGKIFSAVFRVKKVGTASLLFSSASILANDGMGTDVFAGSGSANYEFVVAAQTTQEQPVTEKVDTTKKVEDSSGVPAMPRISSPTHPDQNLWYTNNNATFVWPVPSGVISVRFLYDGSPNSRPTAIYQPAISEKKLNGIGNGMWYSHVQFSNEKGIGGTAHFRFQIDSDKPSQFEITEVTKKEVTTTKAAFMFDAKDDLSGIDHYEVQIDHGAFEQWKDDGSHRYETSALNPGTYTLNVKVFDKAGNDLTASKTFTIEGLHAPEITDYPDVVSSSDTLIVRGIASANSEVIISLQKQNESIKNFFVQTNRDGVFVFVVDKGLESGEYLLWTEDTDHQGLKSEPSKKITIRVVNNTASCASSSVLGSSVVITSLLSLAGLLLLVVALLAYRLFSFRRKMKKEVNEAKSTLDEAFNMLKKEVREQVKMFEKTRTKRDLTNEEEKVIKQLRKQLDSAERSVKKEIEDIEKAMQ